MRINNKLGSFIIIVIFYSVIIYFFITSMVQKDKLYSEIESRNLIQSSELVAGDLSKNLEQYVVDQFPIREQLLKIFTQFELAQNKVFVRETYLVDDMIISPLESVNKYRAYNIFEEIDKYVKKYEDIEFVYMSMPLKSSFLMEMLEPYVNTSIVDNNYETMDLAIKFAPDLKYINIAQMIFEETGIKERREMFYKTDYHWNLTGIEYACMRIIEEFKKEGLLTEDLIYEDLDLNKIELEDKNYLGDLNARFSYLIDNSQEKIEIFEPAYDFEYFWSIDDSVRCERSDIVAPNLLSQDVSYNDIYTTNLGFYRVYNENYLVDEDIVILKDSYQNPMTDFFSSIYKNCYIIDPRKFESLSLDELLEITECDKVLFVYHQSNISQELYDLLKK